MKYVFGFIEPIKYGIYFSSSQIILLIGVLGFGEALIINTVQDGLFSACALYLFVSIIGLWLCHKTQIKLNDSSLRIVGYFWLIKLAMTLFLLYSGWIPQLDPAASNLWGYDPQRYYLDAQILVDNNWSTQFLNLNYVGILFYYGFIFYVLGHNPVVPALINSFVTLIASLYLIQYLYEIKLQRGPRDWTIALVLLLPEMLWYDVMTSRETLVGVLLLFSLLTVGRYFSNAIQIPVFKVLLITSFSILAIAAVRTSMLFTVFLAIILMFFLARSVRNARIYQYTITIFVSILLLVVAPRIAFYLGGYDFNVGDLIHTATSAKENIATSGEMNWSENSIGMLLMPEGLFQSIVFIPPRMVLYLVAPLPNIAVTINDLLAGVWQAWQTLLTIFSSVINIIIFPYVLASLNQAIKTRKTNIAPLMLHIAYWSTFIAIAGGNLIIHERYRVMATPLLWGCAWLGAVTCRKQQIARMAWLWFGMLSIGVLIYIFHKGIL